GTGKSRNANEFHQMAITCLSVQEDEELLTRIKEAWSYAISTSQIFPEIINKYEPPDPLDVVKLIAKHHNRDLKNVTVILVVDGIQQLMLNNDDDL
ncbi:645_t:CDS:2, partial [Acaulospora colombiana]